MPIYEYSCADCGKLFSVQLSMSEHEKGNIACPDCKTGHIVPHYAAFSVKTSKKS